MGVVFIIIIEAQGYWISLVDGLTLMIVHGARLDRLAMLQFHQRLQLQLQLLQTSSELNTH